MSPTTTRSRLRSQSPTPSTATLRMNRAMLPHCPRFSRPKGFQLDSLSTRVVWLCLVREKSGVSPFLFLAAFLIINLPISTPVAFSFRCSEPPFTVLSRKMLTIPGVNGATWLLLASVSSPVPPSITLSSTALSGSSLAVRVTASAAWTVRPRLVSGLRSTRRCWWRTRTQVSPSDLTVQELYGRDLEW